MTEPLPRSIGKFRVEGVLGRGAMGVVFKAHDPDIDRTVAIKLVRTDLLEGEDRPHYIDRFRNEAKMAGRCLHPNIVGIHDFSIHDGSPFLVLEYVDGTDLGRTLRRGAAMDLVATGHVVLKVLDALHYAHGFGIIHRDIKPANILVTAASGIKVTDFGISRALASSGTLSSVLVGTPCYMSPEQCLGSAIDTRSDLFSLGCVLYQMLGGEQAFAGPNYVATTHRILNEQPKPLGQLRPDLPKAVLLVVERAVAKRPEDRFRDAADMAAALRAALRGEERPGEPFQLPEDADMTTVLSAGKRVAAAGAGPISMDRLTLASRAMLERRLAHHLGPMARIHLRRAMLTAGTPEELGQSLAALVPPSPARQQLQEDLLRILEAGASGTGGGLDPGMQVPNATERSSTELDLLTKALTKVIGPIAPRLLRRALQTAASPEELETTCMKLIEGETAQEEFRRLLSRPARQ